MSNNNRNSTFLLIIGGLLVLFGATSLLSTILGPLWDLAVTIVREVLKFVWPFALIALGVFAIAIARSGSTISTSYAGKRLYRSNNRILGGVCAGIAEFFGFDVTLVRIIFAIFAIMSGGVPFIMLYIACWVIIPEK